MNVKIIKLKNQEEILCEEAEEKEDSYTIKNPCVLLPTQSQSIAMGSWLPFADAKEFTLDKDLVMFVLPTISQIEEQYTNQFSAVIAPKSKLVTPGGPAGQSFKLTT